jgi:hypothetical protein
VYVWLLAGLCRKLGALAMAEMVSVVLTVIGPAYGVELVVAVPVVE